MKFFQSPTLDASHCSPSRAIRRVGIVGVGSMGAQIAAAHIERGVPVVLADADPQALARAEDRIAHLLIDAGRQPAAQVIESARRLIALSGDDAQLGQCDLVLESVAETETAKQQVYARLKPHLSPTTILASNTSTIPIGRLAAQLADGRRFLGLHFLHPVDQRPLVEVIPGPQTSEATVAAAMAYVELLGKTPIGVVDRPGFLVNRLLMPYLSEAFELLLDGATVAEVERAAKDFGMGLGPLRLIDEIGLDTIVAGGRVVWQAFSGRINPSPLLVAMYKTGRWGRKSGAGFFAYPAGLGAREPGREDPAIDRLIADWARSPQVLSSQHILNRLLLSMLLEATRVLEDRQVRNPEIIDAAMVLGLGFPAAGGGLLRWADTLGAPRILEMLMELEPLGQRFAPPELLRNLAARGLPFHDR